MILKYLEMRYEYEKDITMLVCSLGFEYKYLNISKVIQVPTSIPRMNEGGKGRREVERKRRGEEYSIIYNTTRHTSSKRNTETQTQPDTLKHITPQEYK